MKIRTTIQALREARYWAEMQGDWHAVDDIDEQLAQAGAGNPLRDDERDEPVAVERQQ